MIELLAFLVLLAAFFTAGGRLFPPPAPKLEWEFCRKHGHLLVERADGAITCSSCEQIRRERNYAGNYRRTRTGHIAPTQSRN